MKKSAVKQREYKYTDVKKVEANTTVDIYGIVKFLKHPFKTRGKGNLQYYLIFNLLYNIRLVIEMLYNPLQ